MVSDMANTFHVFQNNFMSIQEPKECLVVTSIQLWIFGTWLPILIDIVLLHLEPSAGSVVLDHLQLAILVQKRDEAHFLSLLKVVETTPGLYFSYDADLTLK